MDDFLASALHAQCVDSLSSLVDEAITDERAVRLAVRDRLKATLALIQNTATFPAGQVLAFVDMVSHTVRSSQEVTDLSNVRFRQLAEQVALCATSESLNASQRVISILQDPPYIGLPATYIGVHLPNIEKLDGAERISLEAGLPFNLTVQLYDMVGQKVTLGRCT
jgi:hypothetical protein